MYPAPYPSLFPALYLPTSHQSGVGALFFDDYLSCGMVALARPLIFFFYARLHHLYS